MKKLFFLAAFAAMGVITSNAQVSFGAKGGVNFASVNGDDFDADEGLTSFHIGGVASIAISGFFSIQPEIVYSSQGYSFDFFDVESKVKIDYLNIPIMADFEVINGLSLQCGPQLGINLSGKIDVNVEGQSRDLDGIETLDIGAGIGAQYQLADKGLFFQARYVNGLTEIFEDDTKAKNGVISLSVGYMFN